MKCRPWHSTACANRVHIETVEWRNKEKWSQPSSVNNLYRTSKDINVEEFLYRFFFI